MNLCLARHFNTLEDSTHTSFQPLSLSKARLAFFENEENKRWQRKQHATLLGRKLKNEHLIVVDTNAFYVSIDPVLNQELGREGTANLYRNTRGFWIQGNIGKEFSFQSSFYENQAYFPAYIDDFVKKYGVVPGQGRVKPFKKGGYDYAMSSGEVAYSPSKHFNFQLGHGKHFIGEGYRSLLLSDNTFNYPYFKITTLFAKGKLQYTNLYASLQSLKRLPVATTPEALFERKAGSFHYLSWMPHPRIQIGLFEGVIWQRRDTTGTLPFDYNYINPIIFVNTAINGWQANNNALVGLNLKLKIWNRLSCYSQLVLDDANNNKYGYQFGVKMYDLFGLKNLNVQAEYNNVSPYTYGHTLPLQSYSHYNQTLAHPLGANFDEVVGIVDYRWRDFFMQIKMVTARYEDDNSQYHWGKDIFKSEDEKTILSIVPNTIRLTNANYQLGYVINPKTNMQLIVGFLNRNESTYPVDTKYLYISFRTSLNNYYYDF